MKTTSGKLYLIGAFILAGTSVITGCLLSAKLSGFTITAVSMGIALILLFPFYAVKTMQTIRILTGRDWVMLLLQAIFGIFLFRVFLLLGIKATTATEAGVLTGTTPAITSMMAFFILKEQLSGITIMGIAGTVVGIALLQGSNLFSPLLFNHHLLGNVLIICAAASESTFNILSRKHNAG